MFRSNRHTVHVMAVLVTAIHVLPRDKDVDARDKPAHDGVPSIERNLLYAFPQVESSNV
jgi:hypothetical protein